MEEGDLRKLIDDDLFRAYHRELADPRFNVFDVLRYADYEIRHSNVLAWLLRPDSSHGIGTKFLEWFVGQVSTLLAGADAKPLGEVGFDAPNVAVWRERDYVDITLLFRREQCLIAIENKTESAHSGHFEQVLAYDRDLRKKHPGHRVVSILLNTSPDETVVRHEPHPRDPSRRFRPIALMSWKSVHEYIGSLHARRSFGLSAVETFVGQYIELLERWFRPTGLEVAQLIRNYPSILKRLREIMEKDGDDGVRKVVPEDLTECREALVRLTRKSRLDLVELRRAVSNRLKLQGYDPGHSQAPKGRAYWLSWSNETMAEAARRLGCGASFLSWGMLFTHHEVRVIFWLYDDPEWKARLDTVMNFIRHTPINRQQPDGYRVHDDGFGWWQIYNEELLSDDALAEMPFHEVRDAVIRKLENFIGSDDSEYSRIEDYFRCLAFDPMTRVSDDERATGA